MVYIVSSFLGIASAIFSISSLFNMNGLCDFDLVFFKAPTLFVTILTGVFLLKMTLPLVDFGFGTWPICCDVGLGRVYWYNSLSFVASMWLDTARSISPSSAKLCKGSCLMGPNINWSLGRENLLSSLQTKKQMSSPMLILAWECRSLMKRDQKRTNVTLVSPFLGDSLPT